MNPEEAQPVGESKAGEPPQLKQHLMIGSLIGIVLTFASVGGTLLVFGYGASAALGIGAVAALWGGIGFGCMIGGVIYLTREEEAAHAHAATAHQNDQSATLSNV